MPFWCYMHILLFKKKEATGPPEGPQSNMVIKSLDSWRQSICPLSFQSPAVKDTEKGARKGHEGAKQPIRQLGEQRYRTMKGCHLRSTYYFARNTEGETLKAKSEGFQEDHTGWFQIEGLLFCLGTSNGTWSAPYMPPLI